MENLQKMIAMERLPLFISVLFVGISFVAAEPLVGGALRSASANEYPFVVAIATKAIPRRSPSRLICVGTIITRKHVLTTAECSTKAPTRLLQILGGSSDLRRCDQYDVSSWVSYNQWATSSRRTPETTKLNPAIITLSRPIDGERARPVLLSTKPANHFYGLTGTIVGWGTSVNGQRPSVLQVDKVNILPKGQCEHEAVSESMRNAVVGEKVLCTISHPVLEEVDEGGPILYGNNILIGINLAPSLENQDGMESRVNYHLSHDYRRFIYHATQGEQLQIA